MTLYRLSCLLSLLPFAVGYVKLGKHIVKYTEDKLKYILNREDRPSMLLEIFSPTCPACEAFAPHMSNAAERIKREAPDIKVIAVDGTAAESIMKELGTQEFPSVFYLGSDKTKARMEFKEANSADAIVSWTLRVSAPTIQNISTDSELPTLDPTSLPHLVLRSPSMVPAFASLAQDHKLTFRAFWIQAEVSPAVSQILHAGQDAHNFTWTDPRADSLDDDGELFEAFVKDNMLPAVIMISDAKKVNRILDRLESDAQLLWLVLNSTDQASPGSERSCGSDELACSAAGPSVAADASADALQRAFAPHKRMFQRAIATAREKKKVYGLYIDIAKWPDWVEKELYAWTAPVLVAQRFRHGPRYFFADHGLPANARQLTEWYSGLLSRTPRQMSERPQATPSGKLWRKFVNLGLEDALRAQPATLLYTFKSPDSLSQEQEVIDLEDEMEALDTLAAWLSENCERPPLLGALDVRRNEVPLSLYAAASIGGLTAPNLYLIESDEGKPSMGVRWAGEVSEFVDRTVRAQDDQLAQRESALTKDFRGVIQWILAKARLLPSLKMPSNPDLSKFGTVSTARVIDLESEASLQELLHKNVSGFVEFFSPSCGACKKFAPVYESAARKAQASEADHAFARIDCSTTLGEQCCNMHNIEAYPSVFFMHGGRLEKYPGGSKRKDLLEYLAVMTEPVAVDVASEEEAWAIVKSKQKPVIFWRGGSTANYTIVQEVAMDWRQHARLAKLHTPDDAAGLALLWPGTARKISVYQPYESDEPYSSDSLGIWLAEQFVKSEPPPATQPELVKTVVGMTFRDMVFGPLDQGQHVMLEVYAPWCGHCKKLAPEYERFARKMADEGRTIVVAKLNGDANGIPYGGFEYTGYPTIFYLAPGSADIVKLSERTAEDLHNFVRKNRVPTKPKAEDKEVNPKVGMDKMLENFRSEDIPVQQTSPVLTVVLKNFIETVFNDIRHCILMLYAKGCPHCQNMMPLLDSFASVVAHREDLSVAKMDGQANDLPISGFEVKGYPTLFFIEAGQKEPAKSFIGSNALSQMQQYLGSKGLLSRSALKTEL